MDIKLSYMPRITSYITIAFNVTLQYFIDPCAIVYPRLIATWRTGACITEVSAKTLVNYKYEHLRQAKDEFFIESNLK